MVTITRNTPTTTALDVTLGVDKTWKASIPAGISFAIGESSVQVPLTLIDDTIIEGARDVRVTASASGHATGSALVTVFDNDIPDYTLSLSQSAVSEGAGTTATYLTITRALASAQPVEFVLSGDPSQMRFPNRVVIEGGQTEVTVPIAIENNALVDGNRLAFLRVNVADSVLRVPVPGTAQQIGVQILDDDGPTLTLSLAENVIGEPGSTIGTVTRNTGTVGDLVVTLLSDDTTEATVPTTVTILNGQASAAFTVTGVLDGISDGTRPVTLLASATGFNSGSAGLTVTDRDLPDLQVTSISMPTAVKTGQTVSAMFTVTNHGLGAATGSWVDRVYVSTDVTLGSDDVLVSTQAGEALDVGEAYNRVVSFAAGNYVGPVYLIVVSDPNGALEELSNGNNQALGSTRVNPAYRATVSTAVEAAPAGSSILMTGSIFDPEDPGLPPGDPSLRFKPVTIQVTAENGNFRTLTTVTDINGDFTFNFTPLANETGRYTIAADHPGVTDRTPQDSFALLGMRQTGFPTAVSLLPFTTRSFTFDLTNLADVALTDVQVTVEDAPAWLDVDVTLANTIAGDGTITGTVDLTANLDELLAGRIAFVITTAEGVTLRVPLSVTLAPFVPQLTLSPGFLKAGMLRGEQTLVTFEVQNTGGADTGPISLVIPDEPWLSSLSPLTLESLGVGERTTITLRLNPADDLALQLYTGGISLNAARASATIGYQFRAVSEAIGDAVIRVEDEYTYFAEGNPGLAGARLGNHRLPVPRRLRGDRRRGDPRRGRIHLLRGRQPGPRRRARHADRPLHLRGDRHRPLGRRWLRALRGHPRGPLHADRHRREA
jgi:hypothetical protein